MAERLDHREVLRLGELPAAEGAGNEHVEKARVGEGGRDLRGQLALLVHPRRLPADERREGARRGERRLLGKRARVELDGSLARGFDCFFHRFHAVMLHG